MRREALLPWLRVLRRFAANKTALISLGLVVMVSLACYILAPHTGYECNRVDFVSICLPPCADHIMGTDTLGRDLFTRILWGGQTTLGIVFSASLIAAIFGGILGMYSGWQGGRMDFHIMRAVDVLASVPDIILAIVFEVLFGFGGGKFKYGLALAAIPAVARVTRVAVMNIMNEEYVESARALGATEFRILTKHVFHNIAAPLGVQICGCAADILLSCTVMGYLSIGVTPPTPEWGAIVFESRDMIDTAPHMLLIPIAVIVIMEMAFHSIGDGLREAMSLDT